MQEWDWEANAGLDPTKLTYGSTRKVWWKCPKCGGRWQTCIGDRTEKENRTRTKCPYCSNKRVLINFNDLATINPQLASEWHPTKNGDLKPTDVTAGSDRKVWWKCPKCGGEWQTVVRYRTNGAGCLYCVGHKVLSGFNDLSTVNPELASEWHPTKNGDLKPTDVTAGTNKKVWWKCSKCGHEWQAQIALRKYTNCPKCNLRKSTSFPEQAVFYYVKKLYPCSMNKYKDCFMKKMEFDIYIPELKVAIEYDGSQWHKTDSQHKKEIRKYEFCKKYGIYLIRVKEHSEQSWNDTADKTYYVPEITKRNFQALEHVICLLLENIGSQKQLYLEVNIEKDKNEILHYLSKIDNSLAKMRPDVAAKWNYEKNGGLTPEMFSTGSGEVVWWKCSNCGKEWKSSIGDMTREGVYGCPECSKLQKGKAYVRLCIKQRGSLAEKNPELAKEWHPTKNGDLTPADVTVGSNMRVWWKCLECGHEWPAIVESRSLNHRGCPHCAGKFPQKGINDFKTKYPDIAKEWDYQKNYPIKPEDILPKSNLKRWWKCSKCEHKWQATPNSRTRSGLPYCYACKRKFYKKK